MLREPPHSAFTLQRRSPTSSAPGTSFVEANFCTQTRGEEAELRLAGPPLPSCSAALCGQVPNLAGSLGGHRLVREP